MRPVMMYRYTRKEEAIENVQTVTNKSAIYVSYIQCCMVTPKINSQVPTYTPGRRSERYPESEVSWQNPEHC